MDRLDLQEVVAGQILGHGEGYSSTPADPVSGDLTDAVGDVPQTGGDSVAASIHRSGGGSSRGVEGLDLRLQD